MGHSARAHLRALNLGYGTLRQAVSPPTREARARRRRIAMVEEQRLSCDEVTRLLQVLLDGELGGDRAEQVAAHLESSCRCGVEATILRNVIEQISTLSSRPRLAARTRPRTRTRRPPPRVLRLASTLTAASTRSLTITIGTPGHDQRHGYQQSRSTYMHPVLFVPNTTTPVGSHTLLRRWSMTNRQGGPGLRCVTSQRVPRFVRCAPAPRHSPRHRSSVPDTQAPGRHRTRRGP
jgi:hypothetical protein